MIFLIEYDKSESRLLKFKKFDAADRQKAHDEKFDLELSLNRAGIHHEVVLLDSSNEETLRKTHGRYFKTISEIISELGNSQQGN